MVVGLFLSIAFLLNLEQVIAIASAGSTISASVKGWMIADIRELFDQVEAAKNARPLLVRLTKQSP